MKGEDGMQKPLKEIKSENHRVWITQPHELRTIVKRQENAFEIAKGKFLESGNIELVIQTAEAFGRGLFNEVIKDKPKEWTMKEWLVLATEQILNPLGEGATFTKISDEEVKSLVFRNLLHEESPDSATVSLFTYGFLRGMFLSAFPEGELLMKSTMAAGAPMSEFIFRAQANGLDHGERERIKHEFTTMKKID